MQHYKDMGNQLTRLRFRRMGQNSRRGQTIQQFDCGRLPTGRALDIFSEENLNELQTDDAFDTKTKRTMTWVKSVAFSPDGLILASLDENLGGNLGGDAIKLWDVGTRQFLTILTDGTDFPGFAVAFSPDGTKLASGSWADTVELWEVSTRETYRHISRTYRQRLRCCILT